MLSSRLTYVEACATVAAARRDRRLTRRMHAIARQELDVLWDEVDIVELDGPLAIHAGDLAEAHRLRSHDAVHLASALAVGASTLATWDVALARAATEAGLAVAP